MLMGVMESLLPQSKLRNTARLALALVMLFVMAQPLMRLNGVEIDLSVPAVSRVETGERPAYEDIVRDVMLRHLALDQAKEE